MEKGQRTNKGLIWLIEKLKEMDIPLDSPKAEYLKKEFLKVQHLG